MAPQEQHRYLILGLGVSGRAAARLLLSKGAAVTAVDAKAAALVHDAQVESLLRQGLQLFAEDRQPDLAGFDAVVVSPGVPPSHSIYGEALRCGIEVLGEVELACRHLSQHQPVIAVTGTNGKTTVTALTAHVLNACGRTALAVGNIGTPLTDVVSAAAPDDILVVELSSWQLETMTTPCIDIGVVLNVTPDHLDRHGTMEEYARAKFAMGRCLKPGGKWVIHDATAAEFRTILEDYPAYETYGYEDSSHFYCDKQGVYFQQRLEYYLPERYRGFLNHDVENEMAAYALCRHFGITAESFRAAADTFAKLPHRIEFVRERHGVKYFNDSKGTNVDAVIKAVASMRGGTILIAGGKDKGSAYTPWLPAFDGRVRFVVAIGEAAAAIRQQLSPQVRVELAPSLEEAVRCAAGAAIEGDNVLLSPGCASYDMFDNYAHRGREFVKYVNNLPD